LTNCLGTHLDVFIDLNNLVVEFMWMQGLEGHSDGLRVAKSCHKSALQNCVEHHKTILKLAFCRHILWLSFFRDWCIDAIIHHEHIELGSDVGCSLMSFVGCFNIHFWNNTIVFENIVVLIVLWDFENRMHRIIQLQVVALSLRLARTI